MSKNKSREVNQKYTFSRGRPNGVAQSKLVAIAARFTQDDFEWLCEVAQKNNLSVAECVRRCVKRVKGGISRKLSK